MIEIKTVSKPRPFNLEKALAGEHVRLRDERKALILNCFKAEEAARGSDIIIGACFR